MDERAGDERPRERGGNGNCAENDDRRAVRATYDRIAEHFAQTREYAWPEVEAFCEGRRAGTALDVGCGNGRHAELLADHADRVVGVDASRGLLSVARERAPSVDFLQGDAAALPLADDSVGLGVYVATLHHLPTRALRRRSLDELARVLETDGSALVSAWSTAHDRFDVSTGDASADDTSADDTPTNADPADAAEGFDTTVDWTLPGGETVPRFYHIYAPAEFDADLAASDLVVVDSRVSSGNCYAEVRSV